MSLHRRWGHRALLILLSSALTTSLHAQWQSAIGPGSAAAGVIVGSDVERYVRMLAAAGAISPLPWGSRGFLPGDLAEQLRDTLRQKDPWRDQLRRIVQPRAALSVAGAATVNNRFPWGANDGALWQGRGLTTGIAVSASFRWGPLSAVAAPVAFWAQNASFPLDPVTESTMPFADAQYPSLVDRPQRMGASSYARLDPGESTVRLSLGSVAVGITTASEGWGIGSAFPALLGANAGGFPRVFAGTRGAGLRIPGVGVISSRYILGVLDQSRWSTIQGSETYVDANETGTRRLGSGLVVSISPAILRQVEIGASRFFHSPYRADPDRWRAWSKPFEGIFKQNLRATPGAGDPTGDADNQLASFFARVVMPSRGVEAAVELLREDHNWDSRDLAQEPENNSAVLASVQAVISKRPSAWTVLSAEYFDGDIRPIAQARAQQAIYVHTGMRQGHTQRGQLLGTAIGVGAIAGQTVSLERYGATGSHRLRLLRARTRSYGFSDVQGLYPRANTELPLTHDWIVDVGAGLTAIRPHRTLSADIGIVYASPTQFQDQRTNFYVRGGWSIF
jgi:hypothetical protein